MTDAPLQLAAVDLGSNSFRLEIGRVDGSHIERQGYWKETLRLAAGLDAGERLSKRAIDTACECLARMNERLRGMPVGQVRAVGTQTLRQARNINEFLLEGQQALGFPIDIISGREEARLVFEGCMHTLPPSTQRRLVIDIGGASSELITGSGFLADQAESFKIGCVNTTLRYFTDGIIDRAKFKRAMVGSAAELEEAVTMFSRGRWAEAFGSSGTVGAVADILRGQGWTDGLITSVGLMKLRHALFAAGDVRNLRFDGVRPDRCEILPGGVAVLSAMFDMLGLHEMRAARGGLRLGLLHDLLGRRESRDLRDATVERLQLRFAVDQAHAAEVARVARVLHEALTPGAGGEMVKRLHWAAALHEVGFAISHSEYHKHSAYLVRHGDLAGFSTNDQENVATLVLAQRGNLRKVAQALEERERLAKVLALRLAVVLCHARRPVSLPRWSLKHDRGIALALDGPWLDAHPLTRHLLDEEAEQWRRVGIRFELRAL
jgi:exopolyphosphatase/guanosine-5'-triphosphate,3'-diphosphate pyrophosphatase